MSNCLRILTVLLPFLALACGPKVQCPATAADPRNLCTDGVPNLQLVGPTGGGAIVVRGGQPTLEGWTYLHDVLGVRTVVKLDAAEESWGQGEDEPARRLGMNVVDAAIPPRDFGVSLRSIPQPFEGVPDEKVALAVATLAHPAGGNVFVHCSHGRDRTGLVVGLFRVFVQRWDPARAREEMSAAGFRPLNVNLFVYWNRLFANIDPGEGAEHRARLARLIEAASGPEPR